MAGRRGAPSSSSQSAREDLGAPRALTGGGGGVTTEVAIARTRSFVADSEGMPVELNVHNAAPSSSGAALRPADDLPSEAAVRAYLAASGAAAIDHEPPTPGPERVE